LQQHRPALVVSRYEDAAAPTLLWVLMVTSAAHRRWAGDIDVADLTAAGLPAASLIRTAKVATIEAEQAATIGSLAVAERPAVRERLRSALSALDGV
jgi:mRNA interferase MazF